MDAYEFGRSQVDRCRNEVVAVGDHVDPLTQSSIYMKLRVRVPSPQILIIFVPSSTAWITFQQTTDPPGS
jgi:hypothetical protein